jgi:DNA-binding NarL/FixJ family response regulator
VEWRGVDYKSAVNAVVGHRASQATEKGGLQTNGGPVLLVDDNQDFRALAVDLLARSGFETIEAESAAEALELAERGAPSVVVLDVDLRGTSGYALCSDLRQRFGRGLPIIFVSGVRAEPYDRVAGLLIGADDYLPKPFDPDEFVARIARLADRVSFGAENGAPDPYGLTRREREVLALLVEGLSQAEIAERLYLSPKTVGTHIQRTLGKLGVKSRTQAVALAAREAFFERT